MTTTATTTIALTTPQCLALARLIEQSSDAPADLYPVAARIRSAANLDRCDDCGTLHAHADLDCVGDECYCRACGGSSARLWPTVGQHPYRAGIARGPALDATEHDVPRFQQGMPLELD